MSSTFSCPECQTSLELATADDFQAFCPVCAVFRYAPGTPVLSLDEGGHAADAEALAARAPAAPGAVAALIHAAELPSQTESEPILDVIPVAEVPAIAAAAEAAPPAAATPAAAPEPRPGWDWGSIQAADGRAPGKLAPGWRRVLTGLSLVSVGSGILLVTFVFSLMLAGLVGAEGVRRAASGTSEPGPLMVSFGTHHRAAISATPLIATVVIGGVAGGFLLVAGKFLCCKVPRNSGIRGSAVFSATFLLLAMLSAVFAAAAGLRILRIPNVRLAALGEHDVGATGGSFVAVAFAVAGLILFLLFLRGLGLFFTHKELPRRVVRYFVFTMLWPLAPASLVLGVLGLTRWAGAGRYPIDELLRYQHVLLILTIIAVVGYFMVLGIWFIRLARAARDLVLNARLRGTAAQ